MKCVATGIDALLKLSGENFSIEQEAFRAADAVAFPFTVAPMSRGRDGSRQNVFRSARKGAEQGLRKIISTRAERGKFLPDHLFADPAWDILLDLYLADILSKRVSVSSVCTAANVPATTALRWISTLLREGLIERASDPCDHRRYFVSLSYKGLAAMDGFFSSDVVQSRRKAPSRPSKAGPPSLAGPNVLL